MLFNNKPLDTITEADLQELILNQVPESKTLDYKEAVAVDTNDEKKEFLADETSFANASGGHLILGMKETAGVASNLCGLNIPNVDSFIERLQSIIRDSVEPRIPSITMRGISLQIGNPAIVISIPRSWNSPHVVKTSWRFYSRNSNGKYPLDVGELRAAFTLSESVADRIRNFRMERLSKIVAGETPIVLADVPKMILHSVPFEAFNPGASYDLSLIFKQPEYRMLLGSEQRYTFDGLIGFDGFREGKPARQSSQIYRQGIFELVDAYVADRRGAQEKRPILPATAFETELIEGLLKALAIQKYLGVEPPVVIMVSLLGVGGYVLTLRDPIYLDHVPIIDRNDLLVSEELVDNLDSNPAEILRPIFNAIWNSAGWECSPNYDKAGNRITR